MLGGFISIEHGLKGPNLASVTACAAGTHAVSEAAKTIMLGGADRMMVVGAEAAICPIGIGGFAAMKALSTRNDDPKTASRPFDKGREGFVLGDGGAILVLESLEHAQTRGAKIYCELAGFGQCDDAAHITAPDETGFKPSRAIRLALEDAQLNVDEVGYINAHGTSTQLNDQMESRAIRLALGEEAANRVAVSSTKSMVGHLLGGASAVEAVVTAYTLSRGVAHGTKNLDHPDKEGGCDLDYIPEPCREKPFQAALSNSFGFGGHNVSLAFRRIP